MTKSIRMTLFLTLFVITQSACKSTETMQDAAPSMPSAEPSQPVAGPAMPSASERASDMTADLVARHIAARGGTDNIKAIHSLKWDGQVVSMGMEMPLTVYMKRPGKIRSEVSVTSMNMEFISGYDGATAWMLNPMMGSEPQVMPPELARSLADRANMDGLLLGYEERGYDVEYLGEASVNEMPAHKLKISRSGQPDVFIFLDSENYLEVMIEGQGLNPQSGETVTTNTYMKDYRDVGGIKIPFMMEVKMEGSTFQTISLSTVEANVDIDDNLFRMPGPAIDVR